MWGASCTSLSEAVTLWQERIAPGSGFAALTEALKADETPRQIRGAMSGPDGQLMGWTVSRIAGGRRMLQFHPTQLDRQDAAEPVATIACPDRTATGT